MKNYYSLQELREIIPNFDLLCENNVMAWIYKMEQHSVVRMGYEKMDHFHGKYDGLFVKKVIHGQLVYFLPDDFPFLDDSHCFGLTNDVLLFKDYFGGFIPRLYGFQPDWLEIIQTLSEHETSEPKIGDWTDDQGHDAGLKDSLELQIYENQLLPFYPKQVREERRKQFIALQQRATLAKVFDKMAFIRGIVYYKAHGVTGSLEHKLGITDADKEMTKLTGSMRPIDNIYADFLQKFRQTQPLLPFFMGIVEAAYRLFYNEMDKSVRGCVPGEVPPGVKQFY